jgi:Kef-type K+ transport system membrane component KefB
MSISTTALSVLAPLLKDTGQITTPFGQLVIAAVDQFPLDFSPRYVMI